MEIDVNNIELLMFMGETLYREYKDEVFDKLRFSEKENYTFFLDLLKSSGITSIYLYRKYIELLGEKYKDKILPVDLVPEWTADFILEDCFFTKEKASSIIEKFSGIDNSWENIRILHYIFSKGELTIEKASTSLNIALIKKLPIFKAALSTYFNSDDFNLLLEV